MGWSVGYDSTWHRDIGYGVPATCDYPACGASIDRGLDYVCGGEPYGGDDGCGLYFCSAHLWMPPDGPSQVCARCLAVNADPDGDHPAPFTPTPDVAEWTHHKATDPSWAEWRASNTQPAQGGATEEMTR